METRRVGYERASGVRVASDLPSFRAYIKRLRKQAGETKSPEARTLLLDALEAELVPAAQQLKQETRTGDGQ